MGIFVKKIYIFANSIFIHRIETIDYDKYKNFSLHS